MIYGFEIILAAINAAALWLLIPWDADLSRVATLICGICAMLIGIGIVAVAEMALEALGFELPDIKKGLMRQHSQQPERIAFAESLERETPLNQPFRFYQTERNPSRKESII